MDNLSLNISTTAASTDTAVLSAEGKKKLSWKVKKKQIRERRTKKRRTLSKQPVRATALKDEPREVVSKQREDEGSPMKKKPKLNRQASGNRKESTISRSGNALKTKHKTTKEANSDYVPITSSLFTSNPKVPNMPSIPGRKERADKLYAVRKFGDLPLAAHLIANIQQNFSFTTMTRVQSMAIPVMTSSDSTRDILIKSKTGTGKTLAYAVPIMHDLQGILPKISRIDGAYAVILTPTRELAQQTYQVFQVLAKSFTWIVPGCLVGGEKRKSEKARIRKGLNIIVATPGRLVDHFKNTASLGVSCVRWLVLDEADRLMEMGFATDIRTITTFLDSGGESKTGEEEQEEEGEKKKKMECLKKGIRRTVLLSATLNKAVKELSGTTLHNPELIDAALEGAESVAGGPHPPMSQTPSQLTQYCALVPAKLRLVCLAASLKQLCCDSKQKVIVFMISKRSVEFHHMLLSNALDTVPPLYQLHGSMDQDQRRTVHKSFSQASSGALLCTDVAARGLDMPDVDWIIQYSAPCQMSDYIHRVGRTARAGAKGRSLLFLMPHEMAVAQCLNKEHGIRMTNRTVDDLLSSLKEPTSGQKTVESIATELQVRFERFILATEERQAVAKSAYQSFISGYSTYESSLKAIFYTKALHCGHIAKSFAIRDSPADILSAAHKSQDSQPGKKVHMSDYARTKMNKRASSSLEHGMDEFFGGAVGGPRAGHKRHR